MAFGNDAIVLLHGCGRDGQITTVSSHLTRLYAVSEAPGMVDVYELTDEQGRHPDADGPVPIFVCVGQETAENVAPELMHMPGSNAVPGDS